VTGLFQNKSNTLFYLLLFTYGFLGCLHLQSLPIAWTDEVMNLDPALQWHKHGIYKGFLWPNQGSDHLFLSYPPLIQVFHIGTMYLLPFDIFWMRLPFLILHLTTIWMVYRIAFFYSKNNLLALLLSALFMFDKVVFEISRSMRVEVLEMFLIASFFYFKTIKPNIIIRALCIGLLITAHLKMWPIALVMFIFNWKDAISIREKITVLFLSAFPLLIFCFAIQFQFEALYTQMFVQASKHQAVGSIWDRLTAGILQRFWPVYLEQIWVIPIAFYMLWRALKQVLNGQNSVASWCYVIGFLFTTLFMAGHYRYWPPLYLCGIILLSADQNIHQYTKNPMIQKYGVALILIFLPGFVLRHYVAELQQKERNPAIAIQWLETSISKEDKTLILGDALAFYTTKNPNWDYGMEIYPQNLHPEKYKKMYYLSRDTFLNQKPFSSYPVKHIKPLGIINRFVRGETYAGLHLYEITNLSQYHLLTKKFSKDYE